MTTLTKIKTTLLSGFDDARIGSERWSQLLRQGGTDAVNLTWVWQKTWWETFGKGRLLLIAVERDRELVAVAPLFAADGMVINICPEDHLDFVGDVRDTTVLDALLTTARSEVDDFVGFRFYFIPDYSLTGNLLAEAAKRLGLRCFEEASLECPFMDLANDLDHAHQCVQKDSLRRRQRYFSRDGGFEVRHFMDAEQILIHLDELFDQHAARRAATPFPSLFAEPRQRDYYRKLTRQVGPYGWLRLTRIDWKGRGIAFHFGLHYHGRYLWGIPSFEIDLARHSPGELLLQQVLMAAIAEEAHTFDFGPGAESYKNRFATGAVQLQTFGLYPREASKGTSS